MVTCWPSKSCWVSSHRCEPPVHPGHVRGNNADPQSLVVDRRARSGYWRHDHVHLRLPRAEDLLDCYEECPEHGFTQPISGLAVFIAICRIRYPKVRVRAFQVPQQRKDVDAERRPPGSLLDFIEALPSVFPVVWTNTKPADRQPHRGSSGRSASAVTERALQLGFPVRCPRVRRRLGSAQNSLTTFTISLDFDIPVGVNGDCYDPISGAGRGDAPIQSHHQTVRAMAEGNPVGGYWMTTRSRHHHEKMKEGYGGADSSFQTLHRRLLCTEGEVYVAYRASQG